LKIRRFSENDGVQFVRQSKIYNIDYQLTNFYFDKMNSGFPLFHYMGFRHCEGKIKEIILSEQNTNYQNFKP
jgi:hypothetical protein